MADISPYKLTAAMAAVSRLKAELASQDADMVLSAIDSETNALEQMDLLIEAVIADEAMIEKAEARMKRIEARANRHRLILKAMMEQIAEKVERPLATLSISYRTKPIITDASRLPPELMRTAPDMHALARALKDGAVAGAELSNPTPSLTIRSA